MSFNENFSFYPAKTEGLEKLTNAQRFELLENQGNYMVTLYKEDPAHEIDLLCACDNSRIPTHRVPGTEIPGYGDVSIFGLP